LVSFYIVIEVPKIMASRSWIHLRFLITTFDFGNLDQSMISQPVGVRRDHSGLRVNLVERKAQPRRAGKSDTDGEQLRIGIAADTEFHPLSLILRL